MMDIPEAIELIKKDIAEKIPHLKGLPHKNDEFELWCSKMYDILGAAFGENSREYQGFLSRGVHGVRIYGSEQEFQDDYVRCVENYEQALKEIVQRYELVGIQSRSTGVVAFPKAFIAHGGKSIALDKPCRFLKELGVEALVVEEQPSKSKAVDDKVEHYMAKADCVVILATGDDEIEGKLHPGQNVIHEIGLAQKTLPERIIYLLEKGVEFPSNIQPKVWESFTQDCMDEAFIVIARELRAFGLIKAAKERK
jgi:predicted nucleotide-binding protein